MTIWLSAGEPSGDRWGARLAEALAKQRPDVRLVGMSGPLMRAAGVVGFEPPGTGLMGFTEPFAHLRTIIARLGEAKKRLRRERPDAAVVIDFPDFHLRLLKTMTKLRIPAVYFLPPQVWAWRRRRARQIAPRCRRIVTAFDWEREWFARWAAPDQVVWCGHPLADDIAQAAGRRSDHAPERIALLPGSRRSEIARIGPILAQAARRLELPAVFAADREESAAWMRDASEQTGAQPIPVIVGRTLEVLANARAAVVCAGSATLAAAALGLPTVIVYRTDRLTFALADRLVRSRWCGLPNIVLGRDAYPELVQESLSGESVAEGVRAVLAEPVEHWRALGGEVRPHLGGPGVFHRVAERVLRTAAGA